VIIPASAFGGFVGASVALTAAIAALIASASLPPIRVSKPPLLPAPTGSTSLLTCVTCKFLLTETFNCSLKTGRLL
jgi:hypothetical protein